MFFRIDGKKFTRVADAIAEPDGSFVLSTYKGFDGAPVGEYAVTVVWREPWLDAHGRPGVERLPEKYAKPETSGLRVRIKTGPNDVSLNLAP